MLCHEIVVDVDATDEFRRFQLIMHIEGPDVMFNIGREQILCRGARGSHQFIQRLRQIEVTFMHAQQQYAGRRLPSDQIVNQAQGGRFQQVGANQGLHACVSSGMERRGRASG